MSDVLKIGEYQLRNLIANNAKFIYFDLREPSVREQEAPGHPLLTGSRSVLSEQVVEIAKNMGLTPDAPIVLICENGAKSVAAAQRLAQNDYINVFVVEGGTRSLDLGSK